MWPRSTNDVLSDIGRELDKAVAEEERDACAVDALHPRGHAHAEAARNIARPTEKGPLADDDLKREIKDI